MIATIVYNSMAIYYSIKTILTYDISSLYSITVKDEDLSSVSGIGLSSGSNL